MVSRHEPPGLNQAPLSPPVRRQPSPPLLRQLSLRSVLVASAGFPPKRYQRKSLARPRQEGLSVSVPSIESFSSVVRYVPEPSPEICGFAYAPSAQCEGRLKVLGFVVATHPCGAGRTVLALEPPERAYARS